MDILRRAACSRQREFPVRGALLERREAAKKPCRTGNAAESRGHKKLHARPCLGPLGYGRFGQERRTVEQCARKTEPQEKALLKKAKKALSPRLRF